MFLHTNIIRLDGSMHDVARNSSEQLCDPTVFAEETPWLERTPQRDRWQVGEYSIRGLEKLSSNRRCGNSLYLLSINQDSCCMMTEVMQTFSNEGYVPAVVISMMRKRNHDFAQTVVIHGCTRLSRTICPIAFCAVGGKPALWACCPYYESWVELNIRNRTP